MSAPLVGVLALQGDVREHCAMLERAGARSVAVRRPEELDALDGIVMPGGESTTISKLARQFDLFDPLSARLREGLPAFGTCAGMIVLSWVPWIWRSVMDQRVVDHYDGDVTQANLHPRTARKYLRRYGSGEQTREDVAA